MTFAYHESIGTFFKFKGYIGKTSDGDRVGCKLQALVYDILPLTTAVFNYVIGPRKLSANEQFFC